ncbi:unnamed protein product [Moneuplotes crassus]|uniref:Tubulin--tyrosine ligase-like protein 5 n=2 Tax=Euplotes crassus TaxID=5936 RepID=A0AAD1XUP5_EUPCR|nr:unnamed protein product [Moneuplotes crassus]
MEEERKDVIEIRSDDQELGYDMPKPRYISDSDGSNKDIQNYQERPTKETYSYSSSMGSTKDRDNSHSNSSQSKDENEPDRNKTFSGKEEAPDATRAFFKDSVEDRTYHLNATGTMVDISKKRKKTRKIPMSVRKPVSQYLAFIKSPFKDRSPMLFFPYPSYVGDKKDEFDRVFYKPQEELEPLTMRFKISENTNIYNAMVNSCKAAGMYLVGEQQMLKKKRIAQGLTDSDTSDEEEDPDENNFNLLFSGSIKDDILKRLRSYQKINHFPKSFNLGRKDAMWRNYLTVAEKYPEDYNFCPKTYIFPEDEEEFEDDRRDPDYDPEMDLKLWIFKPSASSCGKGIKIVGRDDPIGKHKKGFVISEYIANPHLIEGRKYDLRVYVLVVSYDPLIIYLYDDGLARFATGKYTLDEDQFENKYVHLTNYSVQKNAEEYTQNKSKVANNLRASKWSLKTLQKVFEDHGKDYKSVKRRMKDLIIKMIIAVEPPIVEGINDSGIKPNQCYELYGFDIIIDSNLKPWILEVNISPSFSSSSPFDKTLKTMLVCDILSIVGLKPVNHEKYEKEERKKLHSDGLGHSSEEKKESFKNIEDISSGKLDEEDFNLIMEYEEQIRKVENFELIFPLKNNYKKYSKFFAEERYRNHLLWSHINSPLVDIESMYI